MFTTFTTSSTWTSNIHEIVVSLYAIQFFKPNKNKWMDKKFYRITRCGQLLSGQYVWSTKMGLATFFMMMFLAKPLLGLAHDFMRTPFWVLVKTALVTVTFWTPSSLRPWPRLPMLYHSRKHQIDRVRYFSNATSFDSLLTCTFAKISL